MPIGNYIYYKQQNTSLNDIHTLKLMLQIFNPMPIEIYKLYLAHAHEQLYRTQQKHWLV